MTKHIGVAGRVGAALVVAATLGAQAAEPLAVPARFTGLAIGDAGGSAPIDGAISRWSTRAEVEQVAAAFSDSGMDGLVRALERLKRVGFFRQTGSLGTDLQFSEQVAQPDGGLRITLMGERRLAFGEVPGIAYSADFPLTVIELRVNNQGEGTGTIWPATRITYWDPESHLIIFDNYTLLPLQVTSVRVQPERKR